MNEKVEPSQNDGEQEEREFTRAPMSSVLGAPLSWVALFGALTAVGSLIPILSYAGGGGYASLSTIILFPMTGLFLGPWAGFVAGLIGGIIGMFIAPGAFPMGPLDIVFSGAMVAFVVGLIARRWRRVMLVWWIFGILLVFFFPYRIPGEAQGFAPPPEPAYMLSYWFAWLGFVIWLIWAYTPLGTWVYRGKPLIKQIVGFLLAAYAGITAHYPIYTQPYNYALKWPPELTITQNLATAPLYFISAILLGLVGFALFRALWRTGLRRVPGSLLDESVTETPVDAG